MDFQTEITISIVGDGDGINFPNGQGGRAIVKWTADLELGANELADKPIFFGIKSLKLDAPDQSITFNSCFYDEETDEETMKEVVIELKDIKINKDLGEVNLDDFKLLPTELILHGDSAELFFA